MVSQSLGLFYSPLSFRHHCDFTTAASYPGQLMVDSIFFSSPIASNATTLMTIYAKHRAIDGEFSQSTNTRVPIEPRYALRKRTHPQLQQHALLFLIQNFEKLTIHEVSEKDLSKSLKESVDPMGINFPPLPFTN